MKKSIGFVGFGIAMLLGGTTAAVAAEAVPPGLVGVWTVEDSACGGCDPASGPEGGAEVRISPRGVQNPFGADCTGAPKVEVLPAEPLAGLQERFGLPSRWLITRSGGSALGFRVSCVGAQPFVLFILPDGQALMPVEAGVTLRLKPHA